MTENRTPRRIRKAATKSRSNPRDNANPSSNRSETGLRTRASWVAVVICVFVAASIRLNCVEV